MAGEIHPKDSLFLRIGYGSAVTKDGTEYELSASPYGCPLIRNLRTGLYWSIDWRDLLKMASEAGIDGANTGEAPRRGV